MKSYPSKRNSGFTLVELLVVMGIIAILAGVIMAAVGSALRYAKRARAQATASQIQTAIQNYYVEYGVYPTAGTGTTDDYYDGGSAGSWPNLLFTLAGNINPIAGGSTGPTTGIAPTANSRGISFLNMVRSDMDTNGAPMNPFGNTIAAGQYYFMVVDTDYSGVAGDTGTGTSHLMNFSAKTTTLLNTGVPGGVAVWCSCDQAVAAGSTSAFWAHTY